MPTITITTSRTYTAEDYYYENIAPDWSQFAIDDIHSSLERFLDGIGASLDPRSEWSWCTPHSGLHASANYDAIYYPTPPVPDATELWCDCDFVPIWADARPRLEMISHTWPHLDVKATRAWERNLTDKYEHYQRRADALAAAYFALMDETLEAICDKAEWLMDDSCNYYYNDEACAEWIANNENLFDEED